VGLRLLEWLLETTIGLETPTGGPRVLTLGRAPPAPGAAVVVRTCAGAAASGRAPCSGWRRMEWRRGGRCCSRWEEGLARLEVAAGGAPDPGASTPAPERAGRTSPAPARGAEGAAAEGEEPARTCAQV
jgi:hypothetical protein